MLCLSHRGENSSPLSLSMSPCLKNSSMHLKKGSFFIYIAMKMIVDDLPGSPLVVQVPGLGRVGHVTRVQQQGEDTRFVKTRGCLVPRKKALHLLQLTEVH